MTHFNAERAIDTVAIQQLLAHWAKDVDEHQGVGVGPMLTEDCSYNVPARSYSGREAVVAYYEARFADLTASPTGVPGQRHILANLCIDFVHADEAKVSFVMVYFTALSANVGNSPADPALVGDGDMVVRREADGAWRIARLDTEVVVMRGNAMVR